MESTDSIMELKFFIYFKEGVPPYQQSLFFAGRQLENNREIKDYNIKRFDYIHLGLILRGGKNNY